MLGRQYGPPELAPRQHPQGGRRYFQNYLLEPEIKELNRLTTILLDIFDDQLELGRLVVMRDAELLLDRQLQQLGRAVLHGGGSVSADDAKRKAEREYDAFDKRRRIDRHREADERIADLAREAKGLPRTPKR
nr:RhuM family protein [Chelatococcus sambhunathii]